MLYSHLPRNKKKKKIDNLFGGCLASQKKTEDLPNKTLEIQPTKTV